MDDWYFEVDDLDEKIEARRKRSVRISASRISSCTRMRK